MANLGIDPVKVENCGNVGDEPGVSLFKQPWSGCSDNSQCAGRENLLMKHFSFLNCPCCFQTHNLMSLPLIYCDILVLRKLL